MDPAEAIKAIQSNWPFIERNAVLREALILAIKALRKEIPKSPIIESWEPALCPNCRSSLSEHMGDGYYKHDIYKTICECGQKLTWESEKE